ncbi:MAG: sigma-70 family RNA polymerase sigma factor [Anaerolineae bacterium]|nr:sigma-70 family RNA polymerase sigma factor [Anaerolineae bacterium]
MEASVTLEAEKAALLRLRAGDVRALDVLVLRYQLEAVRAAFLITRDTGTAEDAAQSVFVRLVDRIRQYDPNRPFAPYLIRSVINEAIKLAQKRERDLSLDAETEGSALEDLLPDWTNEPATEFERGEVRRAIWDAMGKLPPKQRAVAVMRFYLEWSEAEMADALNVPLGTVKWRLHDARTRLQRMLAPYMSAALAAWLWT